MKRSGRSKCPGDERLLGAFLHELGPASSEPIAEHAAACPLCRRKQAVLEEIAQELRARIGGLPDSLGPEEGAALRDMAGAEVRRIRQDDRRHRVPRFIPFRATIAAAVLIAAAAGIFFYVRTRPPDVDRGAPTGIRLLEPAGTLQRAPSVFRWEAVRNADVYQFEIFDEELRSVVIRTTKSTSVTLAPEETSRLGPGRTYYWDVEAVDDEDRRIASGQRSFLVSPGGTANAPSDPSRTDPAQRRGCP
jgi:hypothetical protein